jgi:tetratricopeptide (TPR) repeat protein
MQRGNQQDARQNLDEAMTHLEQTLQLKPDHAMAHYNLAQSLVKINRFDEGKHHFEEAVRYDPDMISAIVPLVWEYATNSDPRRRKGPEAVRMAERAAVVCKRQDPNVLDALAAAYAEVERFEDAIKTAEEAIKVAYAEKDDHLATEIEARRRLYKKYRPYRE